MSDNPPFKSTKSKRSVPESVAKDVAAEIKAATDNAIADLDRKNLGEVFNSKQQTLMVQIERSYGGVVYRFGIAETVTVTSNARQQAAYDELVQQVTDQHKHFVDDTLPKQPGFLHEQAHSSSANSKAPSSEAGELSKYSAERLIKEPGRNGKKTMYKIVTTSGRFSQYGIVVWPEFLKEYDLWEKINDPDTDEIPMHQETVYVDESGKYPTVKRLGAPLPADQLTPTTKDVPF